MKILSLVICVFVFVERCSENKNSFFLNKISVEQQIEGDNNNLRANVFVVLLKFSEKTDPSTVRANISLHQEHTKKYEELFFDFSKNPVISFQVLKNQKLKKNYELIIGRGLKSMKGAPIFLGKDTKVLNQVESINILYN